LLDFTVVNSALENFLVNGGEIFIDLSIKRGVRKLPQNFSLVDREVFQSFDEKTTIKHLLGVKSLTKVRLLALKKTRSCKYILLGVLAFSIPV